MQDQEDIWPELPDFKGDADDLPAEPPPGPAEQTDADEKAVEIEEAEVGRAYRRDVLRLALPIRSPGEVVIFTSVLLLFIAIPMVRFLALCCCLNWLLLFGIGGCLASFFFNIITETAEGENLLPYLNALLTTLREDFWHGVIVPITNFCAAVVYAFLPCMAVSAIYFFATGRQTPFADWPVPLFVILLALGVFFAPMVMLVLARNKLPFLFQPLKILRSIRDVWRPYLVCWLGLLIAVGLTVGFHFLIEPFTDKPFTVPWILMTLTASVIDIWAWIYAMRIIGLLWRHYRHRLGWDADIEHPAFSP